MTEANRIKKPASKQKEANAGKPLDVIPGDSKRLSQRLQTLYGSIVDEPLPDEILQLLEKQ